jgi:hypothetical protein
MAACALTVVALPGVTQRNLGLLRAHLALTQHAGAADLQERAVLGLETAAQRGRMTGDVARTLGRLYSAEGQYDRALDVLAQGVALDGRAPAQTYAPWTTWCGTTETGLVGTEDPWRQNLRITTLWMTRYPHQAEFAVQAAMVLRDHIGLPEQAHAVLERSRTAGAEPSGLLDEAMFDP